MNMGFQGTLFPMLVSIFGSLRFKATGSDQTMGIRAYKEDLTRVKTQANQLLQKLTDDGPPLTKPVNPALRC